MAISASTSPGRVVPVAVLAITLLVFASVVGYVTLDLRAGLRGQILRREADALNQATSLQLATEEETLGELGIKDAPGELLNAVLRASTKIKGVFAVRVFDAARKFNGALPLDWSEQPPSSDDWASLARGTPLIHMRSRAEAADELIGLVLPANGGDARDLLVETWVPLRTTDEAPLAGVAQFWIDGEAVAREFAVIDRQLLTQALGAFVAGAVIIALLLGWSFRQLNRTNRQLCARTEDLLRANRELTLAAKTSALGAVAAHLMHELKNPVAGLEEFVATQSELGPRGDGGELSAAHELTKRLRRMINDVVSVMRDEETGGHFELTPGEIAELSLAKVRPLAAQRGVAIEGDIAATEAISGRRSNLVALVLQNLLQNAIEASPTGSTVRLTAPSGNHAVQFLVDDQGPGLPAAVRDRLFQPCASGKRGGSGIGLALSQQLARQAGGHLELVRSDRTGTSFRLTLPIEAER